MTILLLLACPLLVLCEEDAHAGHDHGNEHTGHDHGEEAHAWEWAGTFPLEKDITYTWTAQKKDGKYADPTMTLAIMDAGTNDKTGLENTENAAEVLFEGNETEVLSNSPLETGRLYRLKFDQKAYQSFYTITVPKTSAYAIFAQHFPTEFEDTLHYLKDESGEDIEPGIEEPEKKAPGNMHTMAEAVGASIVTAMMAFIGVLTLAPVLKKCMQPSYAFAVASGVLLACAFMLMWPESLHLIPVNMGSPKESEVSAVFAVMVLLGFVTIPVLEWFVAQVTGRAFDSVHPNKTADKAPRAAAAKIKMTDVEGQLADNSGDAPLSGKPKEVDWGLVLGMAFGDGFHNICDGVVIGVAFKLCNTTTAWTVAAGKAHFFSSGFQHKIEV
jgi:zinc transporter ZupT